MSGPHRTPEPENYGKWMGLSMLAKLSFEEVVQTKSSVAIDMKIKAQLVDSGFCAMAGYNHIYPTLNGQECLVHWSAKGRR